MKQPLAILFACLSLALGVLVYGGYKDTQFLLNTTPSCSCRAELLQCQQMNRNATTLLKDKTITIKIKE